MKAPSTVFDFVRRRPTPVPPDPVQKPGALPPVDDRFIQSTAAAVLGGSVTTQEAHSRVGDHHRQLVTDQGYEDRRKLTGQLARTSVRRQQSDTRLKELAQRLKQFERYFNRSDRGDVLKKPWTPAVWSKLLYLLLGTVVALGGGVVTISSFLLAQPAWDSPIKAYTMAVAFVVLPALSVALFYKALLDKSPNVARRFRAGLGTGVILSFVLAASAFAYLFSDSLNPNSGIDITALLEGSLPVSEEGEAGLKRWAPVLLTFLLMLLDFLATAYSKCALTDVFLEFGWPRVGRFQEQPEWVKEQAERQRLTDELANLSEEEAVLNASLADFDGQLAARTNQLVGAAQAALAAKLDAVVRLRAELPLLYQQPNAGGKKS